ncbi:MAG TPA: YihY/virulence factor BrkB family protein [Gemmatimonadales bacterium]|nr:YihY/virulence factor BrkB family protein [Gemmatimonadales bacterium]
MTTAGTTGAAGAADSTKAKGDPGWLAMLKASASDFMDDNCPTQAAALSYYTVFSLPPLLLLILLLVGAVLDPQQVREAMQSQIGGVLGPSGANEVETILQHARHPGGGGLVATVVGIVVLAVGAIGAFGQLQAALNNAWEVKPDPRAGGLKSFLLKRLFSFGMVLAIGFLLLVSLALSAALSALGGALGRFGLSGVVLEVMNFAISFVVIGALFAGIFKVMPDAEIAWKDVLVGAIATAFLFVLGKFLLGFYLGHSNPGAAFGAAGSLALLLVWIYYSSMIVLFGAEFTQTWAERRGRGIRPEAGAVRVVREERHVRTTVAPGTAPGGPERERL